MIHETADLDGTLTHLRSMAGDPLDLVIIDAALCNQRANAVASVREGNRAARVVVLGYDLGAISSDRVLLADGVLTFDITADMMVSLLHLIQKGERVVPRELMQAISERSREERDQPAAMQGPRLGRSQRPSPREAEILQRLLQGRSNKTIARELGITETTVKVHLKSLLRKINASNRTQAAIWALNNGYSADATSASFGAGEPMTEAETRGQAAVPSRSVATQPRFRRQTDESQ
jgi:two-component system nitrate/nitrite response regulator NarL